MLTQKVWRYLCKHGSGCLSLKHHAPNSPIGLRNLTEQLRKQLSLANFVHEDKQAVLSSLQTLLGVDGDSREWRYLNKGTHEENDREEFERVTVREIIDALSQLDRVLTDGSHQPASVLINTMENRKNLN